MTAPDPATCRDLAKNLEAAKNSLFFWSRKRNINIVRVKRGIPQSEKLSIYLRMTDAIRALREVGGG